MLCTFSEIYGKIHPTYIDTFEDYQSEEARKRCNELIIIDKKINKIEKRIIRKGEINIEETLNVQLSLMIE